MRVVKFSFMWQHQKEGTWIDKRYTLDEIIGGDPYADMSDCPFLRLYHHMHTREFAGRKDESGREIYEGDILRDDCGELHSVVFGKLPLDKSGDCVCTYESFYCKCHGKLGQAPFYECCDIGDWMEIIGNIYENPELLGDL